MTERLLSAADAALRERITELSVHIPCGRIRGPLQRYRLAYPPDPMPMPWQSCGDEDNPRERTGFDDAPAYDLCIVCVRATAGGATRWSWLACGDCRAVNTALQSTWGFRPFALGRHSLMNGIGVRGGNSPVRQQEQIARLVEFQRHVQELREWEAREYSRLAATFDPLADIPLSVWQRQWPPGRPASLDAFTRLTGVELPDTIR